MKATKKVQMTIRVVAISFALVLGLVIIMPQLVKAEPSTKDLVARNLSAYLVNNPDSQVAMALAKYLGVDENLSAVKMQETQDISPFNKIFYRNGVSNSGIVEFWAQVDLPTATTTEALDFSSLVSTAVGGEVYIDYAEVRITGAVSSSFNFSVGTSTVPYIVYNSAGYPDGLIDDTNFVTSTADVSGVAGYRNLRNSIADVGTNGKQVVMVNATYPYLTFFMQKADAGSYALSGSVTSSIRGWTGKATVRGHYYKDL